MAASMFIMFKMYVHMCIHACMHAHVCLHGAPKYTHTRTTQTPIHHLGGDPPNQLKHYNIWMNQDISILFEDLKSM